MVREPVKTDRRTPFPKLQHFDRFFIPFTQVLLRFTSSAWGRGLPAKSAPVSGALSGGNFHVGARAIARVGMLAVGLGIGAAMATACRESPRRTRRVTRSRRSLGPRSLPACRHRLWICRFPSTGWICSPSQVTPRPRPPAWTTSRSPSATAALPKPVPVVPSAKTSSPGPFDIAVANGTDGFPLPD